MLDLIKEKSDGLYGLMTCLVALQAELSSDDFKRFCDLTSKGEELWLAFKARRDAEDAPEGYNFISYAQEVLAA